MNDEAEEAAPPGWRRIAERTRAIGFDMPSEPKTAALLRTMAAMKPGGRLLELGTGTGLATAALLAGMSKDSHLVSVDVDPQAQAIARDVLGADRRVTFVLEDGLTFIRGQSPQSYDLVFADAVPGKYEGLDEALALLRPGGVFIGDDMLPQQNWPDGHQRRVDQLIADLMARSNLHCMTMSWGSGYVMAVAE